VRFAAGRREEVKLVHVIDQECSERFCHLVTWHSVFECDEAQGVGRVAVTSLRGVVQSTLVKLVMKKRLIQSIIKFPAKQNPPS